MMFGFSKRDYLTVRRGYIKLSGGLAWRIRLAVRTLPSQGRDHGFESRMRYQSSKMSLF
jgi:hypothetical protein